MISARQPRPLPRLLLDFIRIRGARTHNLKGVDVDLPRDALIVITGLSGSGKSSLAFDTMFAEGQRRYVESLSAYARQFLSVMDKPDVDLIDGLSPAIAIEQKSTSHNPRSTVGTITEVHDYLRLLFARTGTPHCPRHGEALEAQTISQMVDRVLEEPEGRSLALLAPVVRARKGDHATVLERMRREGYLRARIDGDIVDLDTDIALDGRRKHSIDVVVDRFKVRPDIGLRLAESFETATMLGDGTALVTSFERASKSEQTSTMALNETALKKGASTKIASKKKAAERNASNKTSPTKTVSKKGASKKATSKSKVKAADSTSLPADADAYSVEIAVEVAHSGARAVADGRGDGGANSVAGASGDIVFSTRFACRQCGYSVPELTPRAFSFNSPEGACPDCDGLGVTQYMDPALVINDATISLADGAIRGWDKRNAWYFGMLTSIASHYGFKVDDVFEELPEKIRQIILYGSGDEDITFSYERADKRGRHQSVHAFEGIIPNLERRYRETESANVRDELSKMLASQSCPGCDGARLKEAVRHVSVDERTLPELTALSLGEAKLAIEALAPAGHRAEIAAPIVTEITRRLGFLVDVGLDYLSLARGAGTLSGGEAQRIRLASQIGAGLQGVMYVLDEPSIGLHQRDNERLLGTLTRLRDLGNTVIVVEHDEDAIRAADHVLDIGPGAGVHGGRIVASGTPADIIASKESMTGQYLAGTRKVPALERRAPGKLSIAVRGATGNNLKGVDVDFPLGLLTLVTGVSGSGKSTLVNDTLLAHAGNVVNRSRRPVAPVEHISGLDTLDKVVAIDQSPIGRTPRSNPATYSGLFASIRDLFAGTREARSRGYQPGRFSFNVKGGRCEACQGDGLIRVEMHFLADVYVPCDVCVGKRYNRETLDIRYKGENIHDVLSMTVERAFDFFSAVPALNRKLDTLMQVGLSYITLGQSATTLSGGEAQRIKLARELSKRDTGNTLYVLDEPTTGLHFEDVGALLGVLARLRDAGNTIIVIEHNIDVIRSADWVIDLGPEGGAGGGTLLAAGTPDDLAQEATSHTGRYLARPSGG